MSPAGASSWETEKKEDNWALSLLFYYSEETERRFIFDIGNYQ
jgi:hypothetical protein